MLNKLKKLKIYEQYFFLATINGGAYTMQAEYNEQKIKQFSYTGI